MFVKKRQGKHLPAAPSELWQAGLESKETAIIVEIPWCIINNMQNSKITGNSQGDGNVENTSTLTSDKGAILKSLSLG